MNSGAMADGIATQCMHMGWKMPWYTITDSFDKDFGVEEWHGHNTFFRDGDQVFRTYFINGRGDEAMGTTWSYLDLTPLGQGVRRRSGCLSERRFRGESMNEELGAPRIVDRSAFHAELEALRVGEKPRPGRRRDCGRPPAAPDG